MDATNETPGDSGTGGRGSESAWQQRARLEAHFAKCGSTTTADARSKLGILHPAGRVQELREAGHKIVTVWTRYTDPTGRLHRMARYEWRGMESKQ